MHETPSQVTLLLHRWVEGDREAFDRLVPIVYDRLRQLAHQRLRQVAGDASLSTTELVHEAWLRLADAPHVSVRDRSHFLALASRVMRNLLVDQARARNALKRGGGMAGTALDPAVPLPDKTLDAVTKLDEALSRLELFDARQSRMLELRYFGGLTLEETSDALGVSLATVKRELRSARAWLALELGGEPSL